MRRPIIVDYICPPIPTRSHDFVAYFYDGDEASVRGYGPTPEDAVRDLLELCDDDD